MADNSSISNSSSGLVAEYRERPRFEKIGHLVLCVGGLVVLVGWLRLGPVLAPNCRTMAVRSLDENTKVIISGTSRVERGVDPRLLRTPTVNLSSGGISYLVMEPMIERAIMQRANRVDLVMIELDVFLLKGKGLIKERLYELDVPMHQWPMKLLDRIVYLIKTGGILSSMPQINLEYYVQSIRPNERPPIGANGFNPYPFFRDLTAPQSDELYGAAKYVSMHRKELVGEGDGANIEALIGLLDWLDHQNIRWALVTLPHLPGWINGRPDEWEKSVEFALATLRARYPDLDARYWDASSELELGNPHFHDGLHLNQRGVEIFNHALNSKISAWLPP